jgi:threonine/homoserine/homoserine lactone efflux protein
MDTLLPISNLSLFIPAALALALTPGPVVLYIITRSVNQGRKAGFVSVLGLELGNFVHVLAAALGLSAILLSSTLAFDIVKYLGAAYLIYLGVRKLRSKDELEEQAVQPDTAWKIFSQGVIVATLNPKTALFFFAFLPQFVDTTRGNMTLQVLLLGIIFVTIATITDSLYALGAGAAGRWLRNSRQWVRAQRYIAGTVYIGLGLTAAFASSGSRK